MPTSASAYNKRMQEIRAEFPKAYERWSEQDEALLRQEYLSGLSIAGLSQMLQRQPGAIRSRLRKLTIADGDLARGTNDLPLQVASVPGCAADSMAVSSRDDTCFRLAMEFYLEWRPVLRDGVARYLFPEPITDYMRRTYACPAVYRWVVLRGSSDRRHAIYVGTSAKLCPGRLDGYLNPGASATNKRLSEALHRSLSEGYSVHLDIIHVRASIGGAALARYNLDSQNRRIFIENLLIEHYRRAGMNLLN